MLSPRPVPPKRRVVPESACENALNNAPSCSGDKPMPVSSTFSTRSAPCRDTSRRTSPAFVNLQAFEIRLNTICRSRVGSPRYRPLALSAISTSKVRPFSSIKVTKVEKAEQMTS